LIRNSQCQLSELVRQPPMVGPIVGALVIVMLENKVGELGNALAALTGIAWFQGLGESVSLVTGLIFIVCVLAFRRGIVGEAVALWEKLRKTETRSAG